MHVTIRPFSPLQPLPLQNNQDKDLFFYAVNHNKYEMVEAMLQQGFNPNSTCGGHTSLHYAVVNKDEAMVELLLNYNTDPVIQIGNTGTPFEYALEDNFCVDLFIKHNVHLLLFERQNNQINNINSSNNYIKDGGFPSHQSLLFNQLLTKMHSTDNDDKNNFLTQLTVEERNCLESMLISSDTIETFNLGYKGHATNGYIGHATNALVFNYDGISYLIHTNKGDGVNSEDDKVRPSIVCSSNQEKVQKLTEELKFYKSHDSSMQRPYQALDSFESNGGNSNFIKAIKNLTGTTQSMGNCWVKSHNYAKKIQIFINFLKEAGFDFSKDQPDDKKKIDIALEKTSKLWCKIRLERVCYSIESAKNKLNELDRNTYHNPDEYNHYQNLLEQLQEKQVKLEEKLNLYTVDSESDDCISFDNSSTKNEIILSDD